jgi:hypothetical protein
MVLIIAIIISGVEIFRIIDAEASDAYYDAYYTTIYESEIKPNAIIDIQQILNNISNISDPYQKLEAIAKWEVDPFFNVYREIRDNESYVYNLRGKYLCDDEGRVRALGGAKYNNDPYWIAEQRFGACGELAYLFSYIANQSGFETKVVLANQVINEKNPNGYSNHAWVEVKIDDEWNYYDPTNYYNNYPNISYPLQWSGPLAARDLWNWDVMRIIDEYGNDVHEQYNGILMEYVDKSDLEWFGISVYYQYIDPILS